MTKSINQKMTFSNLERRRPISLVNPFWGIFPPMEINNQRKDRKKLYFLKISFVKGLFERFHHELDISN